MGTSADAQKAIWTTMILNYFMADVDGWLGFDQVNRSPGVPDLPASTTTKLTQVVPY